MAKEIKTVAQQIMSQPPSKIYFLVNAEGKFYNARNRVFYEEMINGNYERNSKTILDLINLPKFEGCSLYETTDHELWQQMATMTTDLVLAGSYFQTLLEKVACKMPTISQVNKTMYQKVKSAIEVLTPFTVWNNSFLTHKEDQTDEVSGHYMEMLSEVGKVQMHECAEIVELLKMRRVDRKSIMGVCAKVRRHAKEAPAKSY